MNRQALQKRSLVHGCIRFSTVIVLSLTAAANITSSGEPQQAQTVSSLANQGKPHEATDTDVFLKDYAETYRYSLGRATNFRITKTGDAVLYARSGPRSFVRNLYELDVATGRERLLASAEQLLSGGEERLTAEELARRERMRSAARGIADFTLDPSGKKVLLALSGSLYVFDRETGQSREIQSSAGFPIDPQFSPTGTRIACVRNQELFAIDLESGTERQLTTGATSTLSHGLAEFVAQEEMSRMHGYWWSPDGEQIVYQQTDTSDVERWLIADPVHPEKEPQEWRYPRPGKNNAKVRLGILPATGGPTRWIEWNRERFPYVATVTWTRHSPLTVLVQNRTQTEELLLEVDPETGGTRTLLTETDADWLNLDDGLPHWLEDGQQFLWSSERQGGWQLELRDRSGQLVRAVTPVELGYRSLAGVDSERRVAYVAAATDSTQTHLYRVSLDDPQVTPTLLTRSSGNHTAIWSENGETRVQTSVDLLGNVEQKVVRQDESVSATIRSESIAPPFVPRVELTSVGSQQWRAAIVRPRDFDATRRYPVLVNVYGGPGSQMVSQNSSRYLLAQWFADRGFVVVSIDGRGTPARGRQWERAIRGNFIDVPLQDQVDALQALGAKYGELDLARVGIFGWSFGGYFSAMAVMRRPDVFHAGIAGAPVCDWLDYDTHYTERYLGLPHENATGYQASSVLTYAPQLSRPLLIIHGTADDNVYFLHSVKMSDALFRAGKPHQFLPLAGFTHMVPDPLVTQRLYGTMAQFLERHLQESASKR